jgi:hypothetical protein
MRFLPHATNPEMFYYDTMILYRYVDDRNYTAGMDGRRTPMSPEPCVPT